MSDECQTQNEELCFQVDLNHTVSYVDSKRWIGLGLFRIAQAAKLRFPARNQQLRELCSLVLARLCPIQLKPDSWHTYYPSVNPEKSKYVIFSNTKWIQAYETCGHLNAYTKSCIINWKWIRQLKIRLALILQCINMYLAVHRERQQPCWTTKRHLIYSYILSNNPNCQIQHLTIVKFTDV